MAPSLCDLPVELIERVIDYLPHRDTLLHLRLVSRDLTSKTFRRFAKAYFTTSTWKLGISSAKAIVHLSNCHDVTSHLVTIVLDAPCGNQAYENIWKAKGIYPIKIARALSLFTQVRNLSLAHFGSSNDLKSSWNFFHSFVPCLYMPKLAALNLRQVDIEAEDAILLFNKHRQTITSLDLDRLDLLYTAESNIPREATPWFDVLYSMRGFENSCAVSIEWPKQGGGQIMDADLQPPWEYWYDVREYEYKGMTIMEMPDDPDDEDWAGDRHLVVEIKCNEEWWDGVKRLAAFNIFNVMEQEEEDSQYSLEMPHLDDIYWDGKIETLLAKKERLARIRGLKAAAAAKRKRDEATTAFK